MIGNTDSTAYHCCTPIFRFPPFGLRAGEQDAEYFLCRKPGCTTCLQSPEAFTIETDCFALFERVYPLPDALQQLWIIAAWGNRWPRAPALNFRTSQTSIDQTVLINLSARCQIPKLAELPTEILEMVRDFSPDAPFWRYISVLELAGQILSTQTSRKLEVPIVHITSWERGSRCLQTTHGSRVSSPLIRLSIDCKGIRRIERPCISSNKEVPEGCFAFIVENMMEMEGVMAELKV